MSAKRGALFLAVVSLGLSAASLILSGDGTVAEAQNGAQPGICSSPNLPIPPFNANDPSALTDTISIPNGGRICDLDVYINASHTWVGDLEFRLGHVGGAGPAQIINRPGVPVPPAGFGCGNDNYDVTVNDEGPDGNIETQCDALPAINGNRVGGDPPGPVLQTFDGEDLAGDWQLTVADFAGGDNGTLNQWCLIPDFCLDHFLCYELRRQPRFAGRTGDTVIDQFGTSTVDVRDRKRLCNPARKVHGEVVSEINNPVDHLVAYTIKQTEPDFDTIRDIRLVNQFGEIEVDLARPDYLMVPSVKAHLSGRAGAAAFDTDHFKCYDLRRGRTRVTVTVRDQFTPPMGEPLMVNVKRPERLCVPADKNGSGILNPEDHLTCYRVKTVPRRQAAGQEFQILNQFETETVTVSGPRELCVPSLKILPGEPTPVPTPTQTPEPTPTESPSCGFLIREDGGGERGINGPTCGGPCPESQRCVYNDGCRCVSEDEVCDFVPPQTTTEPGMCLGLCPGPGQICRPSKGAEPCTCLDTSQLPCTASGAPQCNGQCEGGLVCFNTIDNQCVCTD